MRSPFRSKQGGLKQSGDALISLRIMVPKQWCDIWHYLCIRFLVEVEHGYYVELGICDDLVC